MLAGSVEFGIIEILFFPFFTSMLVCMSYYAIALHMGKVLATSLFLVYS